MTSSPLIDRLKRAGCVAVFLYSLAAFFAIGLIVTLLNGDMWLAVQAAFLTVLAGGLGFWMAQRAKRTSEPEPGRTKKQAH